MRKITLNPKTVLAHLAAVKQPGFWAKKQSVTKKGINQALAFEVGKETQG